MEGGARIKTETGVTRHPTQVPESLQTKVRAMLQKDTRFRDFDASNSNQNTEDDDKSCGPIVDINIGEKTINVK